MVWWWRWWWWCCARCVPWGYRTKGKEGKGPTYVACSELRAIGGERENAHEAAVGVQQASLLERLAIPVVQPNLLILYTRREPIEQKEQKKKKIDGDEVSKARTPGMHGLTPKPIATKEPVAAMAVGVVAPPHGRRSATF